jgi:hypothetical protein
LRQLVTECKDVLRLKLGADPLANVKPLVIKLRDDAEPVQLSSRKYARPQLNFMRDKIHDLQELGLVYKNTGAEWASSPLILPKPGPDQYRMTVYLRGSNASTKPTARPMPNLQYELHDSHGLEVAAKLAFCQGYGKYLCTKILKTVNLLSRRMECTHRHVYYIERGILRSICSPCSSSLWITLRPTSKYGWMTAYFI